MSGNDGTVWYLRILEEESARVLILRLEGRVYSATSADLAGALEQVLVDGRRALVVDLSAVDYINGQGLSVIEAAAARLRSAGQDLIACGLSPVVRTAFDLSGALERVTVEPSREAAIKRAEALNGS